jgi:uncharacterized membrane protein HdeD (DUF308 family)
MLQTAEIDKTGNTRWLTRYYATRAGFSAIWVAAAFLTGRSASPLALALLIAYPAWDAAANLFDAVRNGGLKANPTQAFNAVASTVVTIAVILAIRFDDKAVLYMFGVWAALSGLLQLATGIRRWRGFSAQWPMILSGAQSALAGVIFVKKAAAGMMVPGAVDIAPYAAFGALYFAISAISLAVSLNRRQRAIAAT